MRCNALTDRVSYTEAGSLVLSAESLLRHPFLRKGVNRQLSCIWHTIAESDDHIQIVVFNFAFHVA